MLIPIFCLGGILGGLLGYFYGKQVGQKEESDKNYKDLIARENKR